VLIIGAGKEKKKKRIMLACYRVGIIEANFEQNNVRQDFQLGALNVKSMMV
jgi:hypothetical protein